MSENLYSDTRCLSRPHPSFLYDTVDDVGVLFQLQTDLKFEQGYVELNKNKLVYLFFQKGNFFTEMPENLLHEPINSFMMVYNSSDFSLRL